MPRIQIGQSRPIRNVADRSFMVSSTSPSSCHRSLVYPGSSELLGFGVSRFHKRGPYLSDHTLRNALSVALSEPIPGLYTDNGSAPLNVHAGLRQVYKFGLYSRCAYVDDDESAGLCTGVHTAYKFQPSMVITNDTFSNYSDYTDAIIHNTTFSRSSSLGKSSRAAYYLLLFGFTFSIIALFMSVRSHSNWSSALTHLPLLHPGPTRHPP